MPRMRWSRKPVTDVEEMADALAAVYRMHIEEHPTRPAPVSMNGLRCDGRRIRRSEKARLREALMDRGVTVVVR